MKQSIHVRRLLPTFTGPLAIIFLLLTACKKYEANLPVLKDLSQVNLVASTDGYNTNHIEPTLKNAWGLAFNTTGIAWVNAEVGEVSFLFDKDGGLPRPPVAIPSPQDTIGGAPTAIAFSSSSVDFPLSNGTASRFIFVGSDGIISAWNPGSGNRAELIKNNSATAVYTGVTIALNGGENMIYAANFKAGKIEVWDKNFNSVNMTFTDPGIPQGYAPFNIQAAGDKLYVMYALSNGEGDEIKGAGNGYVSIFNTDGSLVKRFASKSELNAPWGLAIAPAGFLADSTGNSGYGNGVSNDQPLVLIGNFGDGRINAYTLDGKWVGPLRSNGQPIHIDGLWALSFPPISATTINPNRLYFTAGPRDEADGLFGYLIRQ